MSTDASATEEPCCEVCLSSFNKSTRVKSECPYCHSKICRTCLQTYLLGDISDVPRCIKAECGHGWDRDFLDEEFTRSFRLTTYKEHREKVLCDREKARLPETQPQAAAYLAASRTLSEAQVNIDNLERQMRDLHRQLAIQETAKWRAQNALRTYGRVTNDERHRQEDSVLFVKACPAEGCKGFLSTAWKCGLCEKWSCSSCHEVKGTTKDAEHTCDPDKVATATLIASESRACPKCGVNISKISGCNQMFCTLCHTSFDWRTGRVATGIVHNPHYFEWLRMNGGRAPAVPAVPAEGAAGAAGGAGCEDPATMDQNIVRALGAPTQYGYGFRNRVPPSSDKNVRYLLEAWRMMREYTEINEHVPDDEEKFRVLRVRYLAGEFADDNEWKTALQRQEKHANFQRAVRQVREVYVNGVRDIMRGLLNADHKKDEIKDQVKQLVDYCNDCFENISKRFGRSSPSLKISSS